LSSGALRPKIAGLAVSMTSPENTYRRTESTLKRHGYYCRSRNVTTRTIRSRSCVACVKAKARCNNKLPSCSRCTLKNLDCQIVGRSSSADTHLFQATRTLEIYGGRLVDAPSEIPSTEAAQLSSTIDGNLPSSENITTDVDFANFGEGHLVWDLVNVEKSSYPNIHIPDTYEPPPDSLDLLAFNHPTSETNFGIYNMCTSPSSSASIPKMPTYALRSFTQRSAIKGSATTTAMLMVRILTSYPMMLQDSKSLPPFIHPSFLTGDEDKSMESLTTCASLMRMLGSAHGSKSLLWKNVRLECERLQVQVSDLLIVYVRKCGHG
jgi:hypothetical protein